MAEKTVEDIKRIKTDRLGTFSALREEQEEDEKFYELTYEVGISDPYKVVRTDAARIRVDSLVDHIVTNNPIVSVIPRSQKEKYIKQADKLERFYQGWVVIIVSQNPNPVRENTIKMGLRGEIFWKILHINKEFPKPERKEGESEEDYKERLDLWEIQKLESFPLYLLVPDPMNCYPHPFEVNGRPLDMLETFERTVEEIQQLYPEWTNPQKKELGKNVIWDEYWNDNIRCFFADGEPVLKPEISPNPYGFTPYRHAYAGYGHTGGKYEPEKIARSIIYSARDMIEQESRNLSYADSQIAIWSHPRIVTNLSPTELTEIDLSPGQVIHLPDGCVYGESNPQPGGKYFFIHEGASPSPELFNFIGMLKSYIQESSPSSLRGVRMPGVTSGYEQAIETGQGRLKFGGPLDAIQTSFANILGDGLRIIESLIRESVSVHGTREGRDIETISPQDINGYYRCHVKLEAEEPELNDRRAALGDKLWNHGQGSISWQRNLQEYQGVADASSEMAQVIAEQTIIQSPVLLKAREMKALEELGMREEIEQLMVEEEQKKKIAQRQPELSGPGQVPPTQAPMPGSARMMDLRTKQILGGPGGKNPLGSPLEVAEGL